MSTLIDWNSVVNALTGDLQVTARIKKNRMLPPHANDRISFIRALSRSFAYAQPVHVDPLTCNWSNAKVFQAAVWAIGSNMRPWDVFLKNEPALSGVLYGYNPVQVQSAVVSGSLTPTALSSYLPGQAQARDAHAILQWAEILDRCSHNQLQYYDFLKDVATIFAGGLNGHHVLPDPYRLPELFLCLAVFFSNPPPGWPGAGAIALPWHFLSPYKWHGMGIPIGCEFLRNLGWPGFKPDRHIVRLFDHWLPNNAGHLLSAETRISAMVGGGHLGRLHYALLGIALSPAPDAMPLSFADNLLWSLGAYVETVETAKKTINAPRGNSPYIKHNQPVQPVPFRNLKIEDCAHSGGHDCAHSGWDRWVHEILHDMTLWELPEFTPIGKRNVLHRLSSLQSIILMPQSIMQVAETICPEEADYPSDDWWNRDIDADIERELDREGEKIANDSDPYKQDMPEEDKELRPQAKLNGDKQPDHERNQEPKTLNNEHNQDKQEKIFPYGPSDEWDSGIDVENEQCPAQDYKPRYKGDGYGGGFGEEDCFDIIIERYGIYVPSLGNFVKYLTARMSGAAIKCLIDYLRRHPDKKGPAILLCPDLIKRIPQSIRKNIEEMFENDSLPDGGTATMLSLRMILLHELGHHVFPPFHGPQAYNIVYGECLANWFAYQLFTPWEQELLDAFTKTQTPVYRLYQGLVAMQKHRCLKKIAELLIKSEYIGSIQISGPLSDFVYHYGDLFMLIHILAKKRS